MSTIIETPLVVDLDGTLTPTDTLLESIFKYVKHSPINVFRILMWLLKGRAGFKQAIAEHVRINPEQIPYRESFIAYLRGEKAKGRHIVLATAAHKTIAEPVATHLGLFDQVLATDKDHNLKGLRKLQAIQENVGPEFVYAGDSAADIPIWKAAKAAILVGVAPSTAKLVEHDVAIEHVFDKEPVGLRVWLRALRVHQWLKNMLLFVPMLTAFSFFEVKTLFTSVIAFLAFSFTASATYLVNDLWDLENDRLHPRKRKRPFASATLPITYGLVMATSSLIVAFALALVVSKAFFLMMLVYLVSTSAYSWILKQYVLIDVLMLSLLYTLRILAGSVAIGVTTSSWLLAFSAFMFLSLALVKRCAELVTLKQTGVETARGRDYRVSDLTVLWPLGVGAALSAVVVFGLFISAPVTQSHYMSPNLLWLAAIGLIYWLASLWIKTSRGEMHDDPMIYAVRDRGSRITVFAIIIVMVVAHSVALNVSL